MKLQVNGEERDLPAALTLLALLEQLGMRADRVAVELNREIVAREQWPAKELRDGDRLEIVHFVGGGSVPPAGNKRVRWFLNMAVAGVFLAALAQTPAQNPSAPAPEPQAKAAPPCRKDRPVDEYIAEINKAKDKAKKQRNKNPLPDTICVLGWCRASVPGMPKPRKLPTPHPPQSKTDSQSGESSSKEAVDEAPAYDPIQAAKNVEVGDYYFEEKNYRAALSRYQEALESKPDDPAIYLRLGRALDKLDEPVRAFENYDASVVADPAGPSADEARKGVERLRPELEKRGDDPGAISARNRARIVPRCRAEAPAQPISQSPPR